MSISFINTGKFDSQWESLGLGDEELMALQQELAADPFAGDVMKGTNGLRKVRFALPGPGSLAVPVSPTRSFPESESSCLLSCLPRTRKPT